MIKWNLTKDLPPPKGVSIVIGWYRTHAHVRQFDGTLLEHDPMTFYQEPPDFWAPIEQFTLPERAEINKRKRRDIPK